MKILTKNRGYFFCFFLVLFVNSCASILQPKVNLQDPAIKTGAVPLMGEGKKSANDLFEFFMVKNPKGNEAIAFELSRLYVEEAKFEGVNSDIAFIQMCLETGFLNFGGLVTLEMNNFCGLGAIDENNRGLSFPTLRIGVRAHVQHLKAYGSVDPIQQPLVDPRYKYVNPKGKAPTVHELAGTWAADLEYGTKLMNLYIELIQM